MIDANFIHKILELAPTNIIERAGRTFYDGALTPLKEPAVSPITCHTLTGLVDFFDALPTTDQERVMFLVQKSRKRYGRG